jgi:hypothetical protein
MADVEIPLNKSFSVGHNTPSCVDARPAITGGPLFLTLPASRETMPACQSTPRPCTR